MYKIGVIEKIHDKGLELLDKNKKFQYEIIEDISKENLIKELPKFDGVTLRVAKLGNEILSKCNHLCVFQWIPSECHLILTQSVCKVVTIQYPYAIVDMDMAIEMDLLGHGLRWYLRFLWWKLFFVPPIVLA